MVREKFSKQKYNIGNNATNVKRQIHKCQTSVLPIYLRLFFLFTVFKQNSFEKITFAILFVIYIKCQHTHEMSKLNSSNSVSFTVLFTGKNLGKQVSLTIKYPKFNWKC